MTETDPELHATTLRTHATYDKQIETLQTERDNLKAERDTLAAEVAHMRPLFERAMRIAHSNGLFNGGFHGDPAMHLIEAFQHLDAENSRYDTVAEERDTLLTKLASITKLANETRGQAYYGYDDIGYQQTRAWETFSSELNDLLNR
mgnify:CR=1 FL=1